MSEKDLEFSQGDFNVDVVIALGVVSKEDFDNAVIAHGRILHDATVVGVTMRNTPSEIGSINWHEPQASSLCEMIATISLSLGEQAIDGQMATAFLTGIVAETDRFKNEHTTPAVLSLGSQLMTAGANQQLIAEKLEEPAPPPTLLHEQKPQYEDGALEIEHEVQDIHIDDHGNLNIRDQETDPEADPQPIVEEGEEQPDSQPDSTDVGVQEPADTAPAGEHSDFLSEPPREGEPESIDAIDAPKLETAMPVMEHRHKVIEPPQPQGDEEAVVSPPAPVIVSEPEPAVSVPAPQQAPEVVDPELPKIQEPEQPQTLADLEKSVDSPHLAGTEPAEQPPEAESSVDDYLGTVREQVSQAISAQPEQFPKPQESVGATHVELEEAPQKTEQQPEETLPEQAPPSPTPQTQAPQVINPSSAPAVPPPMMPQFYDADGNNQNPFLNPPA
jgi:hypothetical protein